MNLIAIRVLIPSPPKNDFMRYTRLCGYILANSAVYRADQTKPRTEND